MNASQKHTCTPTCTPIHPNSHTYIYPYGKYTLSTDGYFRKLEGSTFLSNFSIRFIAFVITNPKQI